MAEHEKAGGVVGLVFNIFGHFHQLINFGGALAGNRRHAGFATLSRQPRGFGIARHGNAHRIGQVAAQPIVALRQRLRMGINLADAGHLGMVFAQ